MITVEKEIKIQAIREKAQNIIDYANTITAYCSYISCVECPMNVGKNEILCMGNMELKR